MHKKFLRPSSILLEPTNLCEFVALISNQLFAMAYFPELERRRASALPALIAAVILSWTFANARADVIVLANRTQEPVQVHVVLEKLQRNLTIPAARQAILPARGSCEVLYDVGGDLIRYQLDTNSVYFFTLDKKGWLDLRQVDLGESNSITEAESSGARPARVPVAELSVKVLVDQYEPTPREVWEKRLRRRMDRVSKILMQHCGLKLKVVAVGTWNSGDKPLGFRQALNDFRQQVDPHPGCLAIGFTGRHQKESVQFDLGATQGMMQSHILIGEWATTMTEPERTEVLLHEIGHYLGAVHSPDSSSVMRSLLADNKAIQKSFHIGFDPVNTLIVNLVADQIRTHQCTSVSTMTAAARERLTQIYSSLLKATPHDNSIRQYLSQLNMASDTPLTEATRQIVSAVRRSAQAQRRLVVRQVSTRSSTDQLTVRYVCRAAAVASTLPREVAASAFILGLGIALDDTGTLLRNPITAEFCRKVETDAERLARHHALGNPTLRGRRDLARHFFLSAYLTAVVGASAAESAGLAKELADARSDSGFSYRDLAADVAGIDFARRLLDGTLPLAELARGVATEDLMPEVADLPEGISWSELGTQLKTKGQSNVTHYRTVIRHRVRRLSEEETAPPLAR